MIDAETARRLAATFGTPLYVFSEDVIRRQCRALKKAVSYPSTTFRYACKALTLGRILRIIRDEGFSADASSLHEALRACAVGFAPSQILYTGEEASESIFSELLRLGVHLNCSSLDQLRLLGTLRPGASVSVRINPGEGHGSNDKVNTGGPSSKHGIYIDEIESVRELIAQFDLKLVGIHSHIGSGTDLEHWLRIKDLTISLAGLFPNISWINLGGGLPVVYNPAEDSPMPLREWGDALTRSFETLSKAHGRAIELQIEPGRFLVAEAGCLVAEVQNLKRTPLHTFAVVNSGLNHNVRPSMYGAYHEIRFVSRHARAPGASRPYVVAGYLCESGDVFTVSGDHRLCPRHFPEICVGDLMVMENVGAYSHSMKSDYNSMPFPASVLIDAEGHPRLIERRGTLEDMVRREREVEQ